MSFCQAQSQALLDPQSAQKANSREEEIYSSATDALNNGQYNAAIDGFNEVAKMKGRRADGAIYWKAYALNKAGRKQDALSAVAQLRKEYPQSRYLKDAGALEIEIRSATGQKVDPASQPDEDLKLYALDSIMQSDPERALPLLQNILQGNASPRLKDRALFVLSQSDSDKAHQALLTVASEVPPRRRFIAGADSIGSTEQKVADLQADIALNRERFVALDTGRCSTRSTTRRTMPK